MSHLLWLAEAILSHKIKIQDGGCHEASRNTYKKILLHSTQNLKSKLFLMCFWLQELFSRKKFQNYEASRNYSFSFHRPVLCLLTWYSKLPDTHRKEVDGWENLGFCFFNFLFIFLFFIYLFYIYLLFIVMWVSRE